MTKKQISHKCIPAHLHAALTPPGCRTTTAAPNASTPRVRLIPAAHGKSIAISNLMLRHIVVSDLPCTSRIERTASRGSWTPAPSPTPASGRASTGRPESGPGPTGRRPCRARGRWSAGWSWLCFHRWWPCCSPSLPSSPWKKCGTCKSAGDLRKKARTELGLTLFL